MFKAFIFDLDGTLLDSEVLWVEAVERLLQESDPSVTHEETLAIVYGRAWRDVYADIVRRLPAPTLPINEMASVLRQYRDAAQAGQDIRIPGSQEQLRALANHYPVCIVSGAGRRDVAAGIALMGIGECLEFFLASEDYSPGKPDPACYVAAAQRLQMSPEACVVFEDSAVGVRAAKAAGMYCVALVRPDRPRQDTSLADEELPDLTQFSPPACPETAQAP